VQTHSLVYLLADLDHAVEDLGYAVVKLVGNAEFTDSFYNFYRRLICYLGD